MCKIISCLLCLLSSFYNLYAQYTLDEVKAVYPGEPSVYIAKRVHLHIGLLNDSLVLESDNYVERIFLNDKANTYSEKKLYYSNFVTLKEIDARTIAVDGKKTKSYKVTEFSEKDVSESGIFYGDLRAKAFVFPHLQEGAKAVLHYREIYNNPRLLAPHFFASEIPTMESEYKVTVDNKVKIDYYLMNVDKDKIIYSVVTKGNYTTYTWQMKAVSQNDYPDDAPGIRYYSPQILIYITETNTNGIVKTYSKDVNDLYNWCYGFIKDINRNSEKYLRHVTDSIVNGAISDIEKSKKIFYWVQDNIKYIAFEEGYGGFIPRDADDIYMKRYGDCKDMANIISYMHKLVGLNACLTWIGSRDLPYPISTMPAACGFDHMIATANIEGKNYFLDATGRYQAYGLPTSMIQGKEGLLCMGPDSFQIIKIPEIPFEYSAVNDTITIAYDNKVVKGSGTRCVTGYPKINVDYSIVNKNKDKEEEYIKNYLVMGNNKCQIDNYTLSNALNKDKPLEFKFNFHIEDYALITDNGVYVNLNMNRDLSDGNLDINKRKIDFEKDFKYEINEVVYFEIPDGYKIDYIPADKSFNEKEFGFDIQYKKNEHVIIYQKKIYVNFLLLHSDKFASWNEMVKELNKTYKENLAIVKK